MLEVVYNVTCLTACEGCKVWISGELSFKSDVLSIVKVCVQVRDM